MICALIAATAILILTAQRYFQTIAAQIGSGRPSRKARLVAPKVAHGRRAAQPVLPNPGQTGRTSCGAPISGPMTTACSPPPRAWCSSACSRYFRPITALVSSYGLFADPVDHRRQSANAGADAAGRLVPDRAGPDRRAVLAKGNAALGATVPVRPCPRDLERQCRRQGVIDALNVVYEEREKRGFIRIEPALAGVHDRRDRGAAADGQRGGGISAGARSSRPRARRADSSSAWRAGRCCS